MKNVIYSDRVKQDRQLYAFAERGTALMEEVLGASAPSVEAQWDRLDDEKGRTLMTLRVSDWTGSANAKFAPWETEESIRPRLYHLWGDLLAERSALDF